MSPSLFELHASEHASTVVPIFGPITSATAKDAIEHILRLHSENADQEIQLCLSTPGGEVSAGLAILDAALMVSNPITAIGLGSVASMGAILLTCAVDKGHRHLAANAEMLLHQPCGQVTGNASAIENGSNHIVKTRRRLSALIAHATSLPMSRVNRLLRQERWLSATEAVRIGLVDQILLPAKKSEVLPASQPIAVPNEAPL